MSDFIEIAVPVEEIALELDSCADAVEAEALTLYGKVGQDLCGRPALSTVDAHTLVSRHARHERDHHAAWQRHVEDLEAWETARGHVQAAAVQHSLDLATRLGIDMAVAESDGRSAAAEAIRGFERSTPRPQFDPAAAATAPTATAESISTHRVQEADTALTRAEGQHH